MVCLSCASTGSLLRALGRVIRAHQEARIADTQVPEVPFNIMSDVRFKKAQSAVSENIASAGRLGLGKRRKRIDALTLQDEAAMLSLPSYKNTTAKGCSMRFAYFCTRNFFVRGPADLHELTDMDFTLGNDQHGEFLRYVKTLYVDCSISCVLLIYCRASMNCAADNWLYIEDIRESSMCNFHEMNHMQGMIYSIPSFEGFVILASPPTHTFFISFLMLEIMFMCAVVSWVSPLLRPVEGA